jgi:hypothetical protein
VFFEKDMETGFTPNDKWRISNNALSLEMRKVLPHEIP